MSGAAVNRDRSSASKTAVVLSGGGARGAYEAGVLRFLMEDLPDRYECSADPELLVGTSVGAIHACYMAATAGDPGAARWRRLRDHWFELRYEDLIPASKRDILQIPMKIANRLAARDGKDSRAFEGLLDTTCLERTIRKLVPWDRISQQIAAGRVDSVCVAANQLMTGRTALFVEGAGVDERRWSHDPAMLVSRARLDANHALASAAVPVLFPAVRIGPAHYVDGGVRLNTPLAPAIHLGAQRILVIGLRSPAPMTYEAVEGNLSSATHLGQLIGALLADHLDTDVGRLRFVNSILRRGELAFGSDFLERINTASDVAGDPPRQLGVIEDLVIRPSQNLRKIAFDTLKAKAGEGKLSYAARFFFDRVCQENLNSDADLTSLLFFDREYAETLMDLGYSDARKMEGQLVEFFRS